jgi:vacuolar-type H+-ATPase subunit F/Vma7
MSKAYVVGEKSQMLGFKGVGFEVVHADDADSLTRALGQLIRSNDASIVLISETVAEENPEALANFRENSSAIVTTIPTHKGSAHQGFAAMRRMVEYSIGVDMLGKE